MITRLDGDVSQSDAVGDLGAFGFEGLTPGTYRLTPEVGGFEAVPAALLLRLGLAEALDLGELPLSALDEGASAGRIIGRVERHGASEPWRSTVRRASPGARCESWARAPRAPARPGTP